MRHAPTLRSKDMEGPNLRLRLITPEDARYVYALRKNPTYNAHLSEISGTVADQVAWIKAYKIREAAGLEYYFVIERNDRIPCGLVRLYNFTADRFTWGSWILDHNKPPKAALESALLIYQVAFEGLGVADAVFEVRKENMHTQAFHRRFGAQQTGEDETNCYFIYTYKQFADDKAKFLRALESSA